MSKTHLRSLPTSLARLCIFLVMHSPVYGVDSEAMPPHHFRSTSTPIRSSDVPLIGGAALTPGQIIAAQQERLTRERFVAVLGEDAIATWSVNWGALTNPELSFEDSQKSFSMRTLMTKMNDLSKERYDPLFEQLFQEVSGVRSRLIGVHASRIQQCTSAYFVNRFDGSSVKFFSKTGGVQMGTIAHVSLRTDETLKFYVKTHAGGRLSSQSALPESVNPNELMIYKILEYLNVGCEAHFFQRSPTDVYIATLDAGHQGAFTLFSKAKNHEAPSEKPSENIFWGCLSAIPERPSEEATQATIEDAVARDPAAQQFMEQLTTLDLLSRMLRLRDLLNNEDNFGFVQKPDQSTILRILDFRVWDDTNLQINHEHWWGFVEGNGAYNYKGCHKAIHYTLHYRPFRYRAAVAHHVLTEGTLASLHEVIPTAYADVVAYLQHNNTAQDCEALMAQATHYRDILQGNIAFFADRLSTSRLRDDPTV